MKYDANEFGKYPDVMNKEQFYKLCHISKKTALYLLQSGLIPSRCTSKRMRCYQIMKSDVIAFMEDREQYPEAYKAPPGWYSGGYDIRTQQDIPPVVLEDMHENQRVIRGSTEDYEQQYNMYLAKYCS